MLLSGQANANQQMLEDIREGTFAELEAEENSLTEDVETY